MRTPWGVMAITFIYLFIYLFFSYRFCLWEYKNFVNYFFWCLNWFFCFLTNVTTAVLSGGVYIDQKLIIQSICHHPMILGLGYNSALISGSFYHHHAWQHDLWINLWLQSFYLPSKRYMAFFSCVIKYFNMSMLSIFSAYLVKFD